MHRDSVSRLIEKVPGLRYYRLEESGLPFGDWFVFETSPLPPRNQISMVISDLVKDKSVYLFDNGTLEHSHECIDQEHSLSEELQQAAANLVNQRFKIAVWGNNDGALNGQPVLVSLEPEINHVVYPDHPHINVGGSTIKYFLPESLCYTDDPNTLGNNTYSRVLEAIQLISIWLFKHQLWATSRMLKKAIWIGTDAKTDDNVQFMLPRDPYGACRCGQRKKYHNCHLEQDFRIACKPNPLVPNTDQFVLRFKGNNGNIDLGLYYQWWENYKKMHTDTMMKLKSKLK